MCVGPLGGPGVEREHVQVPCVRAGVAASPRLPAARRHLRGRGGHRQGAPPQGLPTQVCFAP